MPFAPTEAREGRPATIYGDLPTHGHDKLAVVFHTTETRGMPWYNTGDTAPHYTYDAKQRTFWRHAYAEYGYVGTLKGHTTGGHGNCKAIQLEIIAYSSFTNADKYGGLWVGNFTPEMYQDLADFWVYHRDRFGLEDEVYHEPAFGWRAGADSPYRLSDENWAHFSGLTAHGGVPRNTHWDTGVLDLYREWELGQPKEELMPKQQWDAMIEALFVGRPDMFQGDPNYWKQLDPDSPEWVDFFNAFVKAISKEET